MSHSCPGVVSLISSCSLCACSDAHLLCEEIGWQFFVLNWWNSTCNRQHKVTFWYRKKNTQGEGETVLYNCKLKKKTKQCAMYQQTHVAISIRYKVEKVFFQFRHTIYISIFISEALLKIDLITITLKIFRKVNNDLKLNYK